MPDESIRETYDLPERPPVPHRQWLLMLSLAPVLFVLWLLLPHTAIVVALLAILTLAYVFFGVQRVLSTRELHRPPGRNPVQPRG